MNRRERRKQRITRQRQAEALREQYPQTQHVVPDNPESQPAAAPAKTGSVPNPAPDFAALETGSVPDLGVAETPAEPISASANNSTGPRSADGKATSSRNAVKHNLCSQKLTGADLDELNAIKSRLHDEWEPVTETERILLDQMALSQWRLDRALSLELSAFDQEILNEKLLVLAIRYRTTAERNLYKALAELQRLRANMREDARRELADEQAAVEREIERYVMGPIARPPQFVSQSTSSAAEPSQPTPSIDSRTSPRQPPQFVSQNALDLLPRAV